MTDKELLDLLRRGVRAGGRASATAHCLDDDTIAALAEGSLDPEARAAALPHIAACERCRGAVASVATALADSEVARAVRLAGRRGGRRRLARLVLPGGAAAAAAAAILLLSWPPPPDEPTFIHRAPTITAGPAPAPLAPMGAVADAPMLQWAAVDGADRYRVTLFDDGGRVLYDTELPDTQVALPDSVGLTPGRGYLWKVEARVGFDRWVGSELIRFSIAGAGR